MFALRRDMTIMDVKRLILDRMHGIFTEEPNEEELNEMVELHVRENLPMIKKGMYTRTRADCEFCGQKMGYREEYCDLTFDDIKTNTSVETASSVTIGRILDTM